MRQRSPIAASLLALLCLLTVPVHAHEGEDHGTPEPVVAVPGTPLVGIGGSGSLFDAVLKYRPFAKGENVDVTLYLVSSETNRPIAGAAVAASLSEGDDSTSVEFRPAEGGPAGAYAATVSPGTDEAMSWLFEVTAGDDYDLIGVTGFRASEHVQATQDAPHHDHAPVSRSVAVAASLGVLLAAAAFAAGRVTARKGVPA